MPTNDERREVALALNGLADDMQSWSDEELRDAAGLIESIDTILFNFGPNSADAIAKRLADLIEPEPERTCQMDKSEFADFAQEYEGLHSCHKCGEQTAVLACVNESGDMEWVKPRFCGFCGAKVAER